MTDNLRVGIGYDIHPLVSGRKLMLGGVEIPFDKGLEGWSDADVLIHAIMDALLGAASMGDIGAHFPPGEPEYRDISSLILLEKVKEKLEEDGWKVVNIDTIILADEPKLQDYIDRIQRKLSDSLEINTERISIKASSANGLGFIGSGEGIAALAVAMIEAV